MCRRKYLIKLNQTRRRTSLIVELYFWIMAFILLLCFILGCIDGHPNDSKYNTTMNYHQWKKSYWHQNSIQTKSITKLRQNRYNTYNFSTNFSPFHFKNNSLKHIIKSRQVIENDASMDKEHHYHYSHHHHSAQKNSALNNLEANNDPILVCSRFSFPPY